MQTLSFLGTLSTGVQFNIIYVLALYVGPADSLVTNVSKVQTVTLQKGLPLVYFEIDVGPWVWQAPDNSLVASLTASLNTSPLRIGILQTDKMIQLSCPFAFAYITATVLKDILVDGISQQVGTSVNVLRYFQPVAAGVDIQVPHFIHNISYYSTFQMSTVPLPDYRKMVIVIGTCLGVFIFLFVGLCLFLRYHHKKLQEEDPETKPLTPEEERARQKATRDLMRKKVSYF